MHFGAMLLRGTPSDLHRHLCVVRERGRLLWPLAASCNHWHVPTLHAERSWQNAALDLSTVPLHTPCYSAPRSLRR